VAQRLRASFQPLLPTKTLLFAERSHLIPRPKAYGAADVCRI
jgi:hypothetical protein